MHKKQHILKYAPGLRRLGANALLADGSVRFLSEATDFGVLEALFGRSEGRPVPE